VVVLVSLAVMAADLADASGDALPPPFQAQARIDIALFDPGDSEPKWPRQVSAVITYSNSWWQIDTSYVNFLGQTIQRSFMRVPDGVRLIRGVGEDLVTADVCSLPFPSPASWEGFIPWLALCPRPELPTRDDRMHRFIDSGPCPAELFNDSRTLGAYSLDFLDHTGTFLSELTITNNGVAIETFPDATGSWEVRHRNLAPPLDRGFAEFTYTVLEVVERQGFLMPVRAVAKRIADAGDTTLYDRVVCEFTLLALDDLDARGLAALTRPTRLLARDFRIQDLPVPLTYLLTNEVWLPTSDPTLAAEAAFHSLRLETRPESAGAP
jgi:hypothetical protein